MERNVNTMTRPIPDSILSFWQQFETTIGDDVSDRFTLKATQLGEFERTCQYHQTSQKSIFTQHRICSLARHDGRISLDDNRLIVTKDGQRQAEAVNEDVYHTILREYFGINLDDRESWVPPAPT